MTHSYKSYPETKILKMLCNNNQCKCSQSYACISISPIAKQQDAQACFDALAASNILKETAVKYILNKPSKVGEVARDCYGITLFFSKNTYALENLPLTELSNIIRRTIGVEVTCFDMSLYHIDDDKLAKKREHRRQHSTKANKHKNIMVKSSFAFDKFLQASSSDSSETEAMDMDDSV